MKKMSVRITGFTAAFLMASLFTFAAAAFAWAVYPPPADPGISGSDAVGPGAPAIVTEQTQTVSGTSETVTPQTGPPEMPAPVSSTAQSTANSIAQSTWHRKTPEEMQAAMAAVPAGPANTEWGTFFLGNINRNLV